MSWVRESNPQPADYKSAALPVELTQHKPSHNKLKHKLDTMQIIIKHRYGTKRLILNQTAAVNFTDAKSAGVKSAAAKFYNINLLKKLELLKTAQCTALVCGPGLEEKRIFFQTNFL